MYGVYFYWTFRLYLNSRCVQIHTYWQAKGLSFVSMTFGFYLCKTWKSAPHFWVWYELQTWPDFFLRPQHRGLRYTTAVKFYRQDPCASNIWNDLFTYLVLVRVDLFIMMNCTSIVSIMFERIKNNLKGNKSFEISLHQVGASKILINHE